MEKPKKAKKKKVYPRKFTGTEDQETQILKCIDYGLTNAQTADVVGVSYDTLDGWLRDPEFARKVRITRERADMEVFEGLRKSATGHRVTLKKHVVLSGGKDEPSYVQEVENEFYYPPDTKATTFWLVNRNPHKFKFKQEIDLNQQVSDMSDEELEKEVAKMVQDGTLKRVANESDD